MSCEKYTHSLMIRGGDRADRKEQKKKVKGTTGIKKLKVLMEFMIYIYIKHAGMGL